MHLLFVKKALSWPRSSGHDVHCFHMMRALAQRGHEVALLTAEEPAPEATEGLSLALRRTFDEAHWAADGAAPRLTGLQERFRSYWGIDPVRIAAVRRAADDCRADAVVVVGLDVLPYLGAIEGPQRVWYAGDEWVWHHLSQVRPTDRSTWGNLRDAAVKGLYERAYASRLDRVWVVSEADRHAMEWIIGTGKVDLVPNGVDCDYYHPVDRPELEQSCVFWGRLDFGPNIQALEWFCKRAWPLIRRESPAARFTIYGFRPSAPVRALTGRDGIDLIPDLPDLREEIARHQIVVLPFISGGGIKNKLLEAAGMARAIVCSPRACGGLHGREGLPLVEVRGAAECARAVLALWHDEPRRRHLGADARRWVLRHHSWDAAARAAERALGQTSGGRRP